MEDKLVAWARAVKAQQRRAWGVHSPRSRPPAAVLWLFSDPARLADPLPVLRALPRGLPRGLLGVVLRQAPEAAGGLAGRIAAGRAVAELCRARGMALAVASGREKDWRLAAALHAGLHLRGGRRPGTAPPWLMAVTGSAHGVAELRRVRRWGAVAFLSPAFATASHPGRRGLGPCRWGKMARQGSSSISGGWVAALGGITARRVRRLPGCRAAGAIGAWRDGA